MGYAEASRYVGTSYVSGLAQFGLLSRTGLSPMHNVLEVGCGALHFAKAVLPVLDRGRYFGIDPNKWLRDATLSQDADLCNLVEEKDARFESVSDFDPSVFGDLRFDRVMSHSVLSHASRCQLHQFLSNVSRCLAKDGVILASIRIGAETTASEKWTYPGAVFFSREHLLDVCNSLGIVAEQKHDYRIWYQSYCKEEIHDWFLFRNRDVQ